MNGTPKEWVKKKNSGSYRRKVKKVRDELLGASFVVSENIPSPASSPTIEPIPTSNFTENDITGSNGAHVSDDHHLDYSECEYFSPSDEDDKPEVEASDDYCGDEGTEKRKCVEPFEDFLRGWAIEFNVPQNALKPLMRQLNSTFGALLPLDPRTLMRMFNIYCIDFRSLYHHGTYSFHFRHTCRFGEGD